jgi:hypothetical protein
LLHALLFLTRNIHAQVEKYIEIISIDKVVLKPVSFVYQISFGGGTGFMGLKILMEDEGDLSAVTISELESILKKEQFNFYTSMENEYKISRDVLFPDIFVNIPNEKELKRLHQNLLGLDGITGKISKIYYEPISTFYEEMYENMYSKAIAQAELLAKISKNDVGKLINLSSG